MVYQDAFVSAFQILNLMQFGRAYEYKQALLSNPNVTQNVIR